MGLLDTLKWAVGYKPTPTHVASPFSDGELTKLVWSDVFGTKYIPMSREEALSIPAVSKARMLICGTISRLPLRVLNKDGLLPDEQQPSWTYRTDGQLSPYLRMTWTCDSMLFFGSALWQVQRGSEGQLLTAEFVDFSDWKLEDGVIRIYDEPMRPEQYIYFPGPIEGILDRAVRTLGEARDIAQAVANRIKSPAPVTEIHGTDNQTWNAEEAQELVRGYNAHRSDPDGVTVATPPDIELKLHGIDGDATFMTEGRNASRLDIANHFGIPAALVEGATDGTSYNYENLQGRNQELLDGLSQWVEAIQGRLSQDDVVPRGQRVRFDTTDFTALTPAPTGAVVND